jgi:Ca2+-binding EF-hand superfamily protein
MRINATDVTTSLEALRQQFFTRTDRDGDGRVSKEEFAATAPTDVEATQRPTRVSDEIFSLLDANDDGSIDLAEADGGMRATESWRPHGGRPDGPPSPQNIARSMMQKTDADQNGSVTESELLSAIGKSDGAKDALRKLFADADSDGDGAVTQSDLQQALQQRFEGLSTYGPAGMMARLQGSRLSVVV